MSATGCPGKSATAVASIATSPLLQHARLRANFLTYLDMSLMCLGVEAPLAVLALKKGGVRR